MTTPSPPRAGFFICAPGLPDGFPGRFHVGVAPMGESRPDAISRAGMGPCGASTGRLGLTYQPGAKPPKRPIRGRQIDFHNAGYSNPVPILPRG